MRLKRLRQSLRISRIFPRKKSTPRQENAIIKSNKDQIPELINIPVTSFETPSSVVQENTAMEVAPVALVNDIIPETPVFVPLGIFDVGLLAPRTDIPQTYVETRVSPKNIPIISKASTSDYFFITYDNLNIPRATVSNTLRSFAVIKMLSPCTIKDCSEMLRLKYSNIKEITESDYLTGSFEHPKYLSDSGYPLQIRYAEIAIIKQKTPGRLDDIPLGYPDFDSTPDGVTTRKGPVPTPPYPDFNWYNEPKLYVSSPGATSSGSTISVPTTFGLTAGMYISITTSDIGILAANTRVTSVIDNSKFTVSPSPLTPLSGTKNVITGYLPLSVSVGASASFVDSSVRNPWQFAPTGWNWVFGASASPTGSTGRNPTVVYNHTGIYTVIMTASNAAGSAIKTKTNFVIVT